MDALEKFQRALRESFQVIQENPLAFPVSGVRPAFRDLAVRRVLISGSPYGLLYIVLEREQVVRVLACYHTRRNPESWLE